MAEYITMLSVKQKTLFIFNFISLGIFIEGGYFILCNQGTKGIREYVLTFIKLIIIIKVLENTMIFASFKRKVTLKLEKQKLLDLIDQQKCYHTEAERRNLEIRKFMHDYSSHLLILNKYLEEKDTFGAHNYLMKLGYISNETRDINTGNSIVNAIINYHLPRIREQNIDLKWSGHIKENCGIEDIDLCIIFSNIIINAIEAVSTLREKTKIIELEGLMIKNVLHISQSNYIENSLCIKNGMPVTSKKNYMKHGLGLKNVKRVVDSYSGRIEIQAEEQYKIEISLLV